MQSTNQGTVSPTHYNLIYDSSGWNLDRHQLLAYKLCHLYYNWAGAIRVPGKNESKIVTRFIFHIKTIKKNLLFPGNRFLKFTISFHAAPCQYAHKLAFMVNQNLHRAPSDNLREKLWYL